MAKVYVLTTATGESIDTRTFSTREKAQKVMRDKYEAEKYSYLSEYGEENVTYDLSENEGNVQLAGRYVEEHVDFVITECEIE